MSRMERMTTRIGGWVGMAVLAAAGVAGAAPAPGPMACVDAEAAAHRTAPISWSADPAPVARERFASVRFDRPASCPAEAPRGLREDAGAVLAGEVGAATTGGQRPVVFIYSDAYQKRARIHRIASYATLPLFAIEAVVGQKMFNNPAAATGATRQLHRWVAIGLEGLFGLNSVTGVMNLWEARKDPNGKTLRTIHGVLMLVSDAGFVATALTAPRHSPRGLLTYDAKKNQHMALAYASITTATVGYLIMLFGR
jgi:hypothetical protein